MFKFSTPRGRSMAIAGLALVCIGIYVWSCGPWYHGRTLASWLDDYGSGPGDYHPAPKTDAVLRQLGTKAVPTLLQLLGNTNSASGLKWVEKNSPRYPGWVIYSPAASSGWWDRIKAWFGKFPWRLRYVTRPASWDHWKAYVSFQALGPAGSPAIPELARLAHEDARSNGRYYDIWGMTDLVWVARIADNSGTYVAPGASPFFGGGTVLRSTNEFLVDGEIAARSLGAIGKDAVPALLDLLHDPAPRLRARAAGALGMVGGAAEPAIPELITNLLNPASDLEVRMASADALGWIGRRPETVIPALVAALKNLDDPVMRYALGSIGRFGDRATNTIPMLLGLCKADDYRIRESGIMALNAVSHAVAVREIVPVLVAQAHDPDLYVRNRMIINLSIIHPPPDEVVPVFTAALDDTNSMIVQNSMRDLGAYGHEAASAVPKLQMLANGAADEWTRECATNALAKIKGP